MYARTIAFVACLLGQSVSAQSTVNVPIDQARAIATNAILSGDIPLAQEIARKLLAQNPDDRVALLVLAAAAPQSGDPAEGRAAGARAWRLSETDAQKYEAARLTALAAASEKRFTLSTLWLRRALTVAPNDAEYNRTIADARTVKQLNPWSTYLGFSVVPSDNVNGGAVNSELTAPGLEDNPFGSGATLSEDALALEGIRASFSFSTQYRMYSDEKRRLSVGLRYQGARVKLTDAEETPDASFDTNSFELNARYDEALSTGAYGLSLAAGTTDYRDLDSTDLSVDKRKYDNIRLGADYRYPISAQSELGLSAQIERLTYEETSIGEVNRKIVRASYGQRLDNGDRWNTSLSYTDGTGDSANYTSNAWTIQFGYNWNEAVGPITLGVSAGRTWTEYPGYTLFGSPITGGRQDTTNFYTINVGFPAATYAGFTPGLTWNHSLSDSNVSRFTRETRSLGVTINSAF